MTNRTTAPGEKTRIIFFLVALFVGLGGFLLFTRFWAFALVFGGIVGVGGFLFWLFFGVVLNAKVGGNRVTPVPPGR